MGAHGNNLLLWGILIGVVGGIVSGWYLGETMMAFAWIGTLFLNALKMTIVPLIIAAVISGVASMGDVRKLGRIGGLTILYYATTTSIAVFIGLVIVNIIQPGAAVTELSEVVPENVSGKSGAGFEDIILSIIHPSLVDAAVSNNLPPIIVFSIFFAAALTMVGDKGAPVIAFFDACNDVMMRLVIWLMYLAPIGVFALIAARLGATGGGEAFWNEIKSVGWYCVSVLLGLLLHFVLLVGILYAFSERGLAYLKNMLRALMTAFGTASSSATLPLTMECAIEAGVDKRSVKLVLPLGATVNMDGTALYEAVAVMFIAQAYGFSLGLGDQIVIFITATLAAIGAAGIPQAGLVTMVIVLTAVGLPLEGIGMLLVVDWFLDRFRTTVNVWGDSTGAALLQRVLPKAI